MSKNLQTPLHTSLCSNAHKTYVINITIENLFILKTINNELKDVCNLFPVYRVLIKK